MNERPTTWAPEVAAGERAAPLGDLQEDHSARIDQFRPVVQHELRTIADLLPASVCMGHLEETAMEALRQVVRDSHELTDHLLTPTVVRVVRAAIIGYLREVSSADEGPYLSSYPASRPPTPGMPPTPTAAAQARLRALRGAVEVMPERLRLVIVECFIRDTPLSDVARMLGEPERVVVQLRADALGFLRESVGAAAHHAVASTHPHGQRYGEWAQHHATMEAG